MLPDSQKFKRFLSQIERLLNGSEFPPSWPEIAQMSEFSEPEILEHIFLLASSNKNLKTPFDALEYLLHCTLLELMIQIRHGQSAPQEKWGKLQSILIAALNSEQGNDDLLTLILDHISTHNLPFEPETLQATIDWQQNKFEPTDEEANLTQEEINSELISHLEQLHISSEFEFYQLFADRLTFFADEAIEGFVFDLLGADQPILREGALLFLLHKRKAVRSTIIGALHDVFFQQKVSPKGLRRLITSRNWLPSDGKTQIDTVIKSIRKTGLPCESASVPDSIKVVKIYASTTDGVGAASVISIFKVGPQFALVGAILKEHYGVLDAWVSPLTTRKECENQISHMKSEIYCLETSEEWVRCTLPHFLALNVQSGEPLTAETLLWTEWLGLNIWQPQPLDLPRLLKQWHEEFPSLFSQNAHKKALSRSAKWIEKAAFSQGWFEQDDQLEKRVHKFFSHDLPEESLSTVDYLLSPHRAKWRDRFVLLALWAKHNTKKRGPHWQDFAIISAAIDSSKDLHDIPIMRSIAYNTLDYYSAISLQNEKPIDAPHLRSVPKQSEAPRSAESKIDPEDETLFFQTHGFLCAICCAPQEPDPKVWMQYLLESLFLDFDTEDHSEILEAFFDDVIDQYNDILLDLENDTLDLPNNNILSLLQTSYWSEGFMHGVDCAGGIKKWDKKWQKKEFESLRAGLSLIDSASKQDPSANALLVEAPEFTSHLVSGFYTNLGKTL
ncbi:MAG: UPF0149 family protein [Pseudomonadales bacterium]|nr:UPF0149 family protein [Pseudomonadales bacterium]